MLRSSVEKGVPGTALRRLALALVLLMLVVTSASAWLRLWATPRAACGDWPACRGSFAAAGAAPAAAAEPGAALRATAERVRLVHRAAASAALLGIIVALAMLWRRPREERDAGMLRSAAMLLALALALSALGVATPASRSTTVAGAASPWVVLGNLLGGMAMVAAAARLWSQAERAPHVPPALAQQARWLMALLFVQMAGGALSGAGALHLAAPLHLAVAMAALPWAFALGLWAWRSGRTRAGLGLVAVAVLQLALGIWAVNEAAAASAVWAHNLGAALSIAALSVLR